MADNPTITDDTLDLIKRWEGFRSEPYLDSVGVKTIGYGFTSEGLSQIGVTMPRHITESAAERLLRRLLRGHYAPKVLELAKVDLAPYQLGALLSFSYNLGVGAFSGSTLLEKLNAGAEEEAEKEFLRWVYAGGKVLDGLIRRRKAEKALFEKDERIDIEVPDEPMAVADGEIHPVDSLEDMIPTELA